MLAITGSSGWIGSNALDYFQNFNNSKILDSIILYTSDGRKLKDLNTYSLDNIRTKNNLSSLFHTAFIRKALLSKYKIDEYIKNNRSITNNILTSLENNPGIPIISISSGAAANTGYYEKGLINDPYGYLKKEEEIKLSKFSKDRMVLIFRVYAATGPFLKLPTNYAFGQFMKNIIDKNPIKIKANTKVFRSYVYIPDLIKLSFSILNKPLDNGFYLIDACTNTLELFDLAKTFKKTFKDASIIRNKINEKPNYYVGNEMKFLDLLKQYNLKPTPLKQQIKNSIENIIY